MTTVVKIGSSSLTRADGYLDLNRIDWVSRVLAGVLLGDAAAGRAPEPVVLVSSGAISAGSLPLGRVERPRDLATAQAVAAVGQGLLMARWTEAMSWHRVVAAQVLLSASEASAHLQYTNASRALGKLLGLGVIPIVNENDAVATDEIRFGDNDRLAAIVSHMVKARRLILCTDVDGLYTAKPGTPGARLISEVRGPGDLAGVDIGGSGSRWGTGGMETKLLAAQTAAANGTEVVLTSTDNLGAALAGAGGVARVGTTFRVTGPRRGIKQLWLAYAASSQGRLVLDAGAAQAITIGKKSLLAAGITQVEGQFAAGDIVEMCDTSGEVLAKGVSSYSAAQISALLQGKGDAPIPVVHRDHLAEIRY